MKTRMEIQPPRPCPLAARLRRNHLPYPTAAFPRWRMAWWLVRHQLYHTAVHPFRRPPPSRPQPYRDANQPSRKHHRYLVAPRRHLRKTPDVLRLSLHQLDLPSRQVHALHSQAELLVLYHRLCPLGNFPVQVRWDLTRSLRTKRSRLFPLQHVLQHSLAGCLPRSGGLQVQAALPRLAPIQSPGNLLYPPVDLLCLAMVCLPSRLANHRLYRLPVVPKAAAPMASLMVTPTHPNLWLLRSLSRRLGHSTTKVRLRGRHAWCVGTSRAPTWLPRSILSPLFLVTTLLAI